MAYFWLNQKKSDGRNYHDEIGEVYRYRGNTPGTKQLSEGHKFVYYRPRVYELFGTGEIDRIETEKKSPETDSGVTVDYFAHIIDYRSFEPPIRLKGVNEHDIRNKISFLKEKPGLTGVPQHSIHKISSDDFNTIVEAAEIDASPTETRE